VNTPLLQDLRLGVLPCDSSEHCAKNLGSCRILDLGKMGSSCTSWWRALVYLSRGCGGPPGERQTKTEVSTSTAVASGRLMCLQRLFKKKMIPRFYSSIFQALPAQSSSSHPDPGLPILALLLMLEKAQQLGLHEG